MLRQTVGAKRVGAAGLSANAKKTMRPYSLRISNVASAMQRNRTPPYAAQATSSLVQVLFADVPTGVALLSSDGKSANPSAVLNASVCGLASVAAARS